MMDSLPEPYVAYTCGIDYENEMNDIPVELSPSEEPEMCDDDCGWFELAIRPIKFIPVEDRPYMPKHDPDPLVIDFYRQGRGRGRLMLIPTDHLYAVSPASHDDVNFDADIHTERSILAQVTLNRIVKDGRLCYLKASDLLNRA